MRSVNIANKEMRRPSAEARGEGSSQIKWEKSQVHTNLLEPGVPATQLARSN